MDSLNMHFNVKYKSSPLELHKKYYSLSATLEIETFKFYVSNIEVQYADNTLGKSKNNYHLIDIENLNSLSIPIAAKQNNVISKVTFNIGIDSTASVSGALAGDLDPTNGMYWAWQSGYINMKIEGRSPQCKNRKNIFQYHIGGYLQPFYAMRRVEMLVNAFFTERGILKLDVSKFFENIQIASQNSIMIPCKEAMQLADYSTSMFSIYVPKN